MCIQWFYAAPVVAPEAKGRQRMSRVSEIKHRTARQREATAASRTRYARAAELERLATSDPDDEAIRRAHGFDLHADDYDEPCRNGCGRSYADVIAGKVRECPASQHAATQRVEQAEAELWADRATLLSRGG